jgi:hypothetical protein
MQFTIESGAYFLVEADKRVPLTRCDLLLFRRMSPLGRKIALRHRAMDIIRSNPENPEAGLMLSLAQRPAHEWSFSIPD